MQSVVRNTAFVALLGLVTPAAGGAETLQLFAAGSLKAALSETAAAYVKVYASAAEAAKSRRIIR